MSTRAEDQADSERTPLLKSNGGPVSSQDGQAAEQDASQSDTPLAEEPSTLKLAIILGSVWIGVFLNALGMLAALSSSERTKLTA